MFKRTLIHIPPLKMRDGKWRKMAQEEVSRIFFATLNKYNNKNNLIFFWIVLALLFY